MEFYFCCFAFIGFRLSPLLSSSFSPFFTHTHIATSFAGSLRRKNRRRAAGNAENGWPTDPGTLGSPFFAAKSPIYQFYFLPTPVLDVFAIVVDAKCKIPKKVC